MRFGMIFRFQIFGGGKISIDPRTPGGPWIFQQDAALSRAAVETWASESLQRAAGGEDVFFWANGRHMVLLMMLVYPIIYQVLAPSQVVIAGFLASACKCGDLLSLFQGLFSLNYRASNSTSCLSSTQISTMHMQKIEKVHPGCQNPPEMVDFSKIPMVFWADFQTHPRWTLFFGRKVLKLKFVWIGVVDHSGCAYVGEKEWVQESQVVRMRNILSCELWLEAVQHDSTRFFTQKYLPSTVISNPSRTL